MGGYGAKHLKPDEQSRPVPVTRLTRIPSRTIWKTVPIPEIQSLPPKLYMWKLSETLGNRTIIPADTASLNFQSTNLVEGMFGHYNYLGNLGSPRLSRLFFEREESEPTIFMAPFSSFLHVPTRCFSPTATCLTPILPTTKPAK